MKKEIIKDTLLYGSCTYLSQFLDLVNGILVRRFLGPTSMGIWAFLQVILNYAKHSSLGITGATARDIPYFRAKGEEEKADEVKDQVMSFTLTTALISALGIALTSIFLRGSISNTLFAGLLFVSALVILQRLHSLLVVLLRAYKLFDFAGVVNIASSALGLIFTLVLVWRFGLTGFFIGMVLNFLVISGWILKRTGIRLRYSIRWQTLKPLLQFGSAMILLDILRSLFTSIDRLVITQFLGFKELGFYSIALMANNYLYSFPNMMGIVFFPYFQEAYGGRDQIQDLEKLIVRPVCAIGFLFPILIGVIWITAPYFIHWILPDYVQGLTALNFLIIGSFFLSLGQLFNTFFITIRRHWSLLPILALSLGLAYFLNLLMVHQGWGITGIALGTSLAYLLYYLMLSLAGVTFFEKARAVILRKIFSASLLPLAYCLLLLTLGDRLFAARAASLKITFLELALFTLLASPLLVMVERRLSLFSMLWGFVKEPNKSGVFLGPRSLRSVQAPAEGSQGLRTSGARGTICAHLFVLNYNGADLLKECLPSMIEAVRWAKTQARLTVIDNQSTDESLEVLAREFPSVDLYKARENRVLCSFNEAVAETDAEVVILLNNDLKVERDFVDPLVAPFIEDRRVFMVVPRTHSFSGQFEGGRTRAFIRWGIFGTAHAQNGQGQGVRSFTFSAGYGAFDRRKFLELGGFDDLYLPGRVEDNDLGFRAWKRGYLIYYEPRSVVYHQGGVSFHRRFGARGTLVINFRNTFLFMWKNLREPRILFTHLIFSLPRALFALLRGKPELLMGLFQAIPLLPKALQRRRETLKEAYVMTDREVFKLHE